jgi:predicted  nucleic acid-binding Zn-ribbon protein
MAQPLSPETPEVLNTVDLDEISLSQALLDFEVANARVIDLTKRLTTMNKELVKATTALQRTQLRNRQLDAELKAIKQSRAFRSAELAARVARGARSRLGG